jgi:hypothetical protein
MEELIKQAFLHVDIIGPHVHEGHYDLVGPDGEIILPQVWETMVQPDWAITMHMWPMPEPPQVKHEEPPPPPPPDSYPQWTAQQLPIGKSKSLRQAKDKVKLRRESHPHVVQVPPPPPGMQHMPMPMPPPPPPGMQGGPPPPPGVVIMAQGAPAPKPKKKAAPAPFFRWAAGPAKKKK